MKLTFCGAARTVTGSAHLLTLNNGMKILLDCGLYQGREDEMERFNQEWPHFAPAALDAVVLSHAHIDHSGRLPKLVKDGFTGKIYCTHATRDLCAIMLHDSAYIQEKDAEFDNKRAYRQGGKRVEPLYTVADVEPALDQMVSVGYGKWLEIMPGVEVLFLDAGHILGSATVTLRLGDEYPFMLGFSGDIGRWNRPILQNPDPMPPLDALIIESTYGGRLHDTEIDADKDLLRVIRETCIDNKGKLLVPAFSVGRTQELVYRMNQWANDGSLPKIPVYVDSPLAVNATDIFRSHPECFDGELRAHMHRDPDPFGFNRLHYIRSVADSKELNTKEDPCIIISASGMMEGGRIRHHVFNNIEDGRNTILFVGFCAPGTLGEALRNKPEKIHLFGEEKQVRARIEILDAFSAHADQGELIKFLSQQSPKQLKQLFLVHGEYEQQVEFREALMDKGYRDVAIPDLGSEHELKEY